MGLCLEEKYLFWVIIYKEGRNGRREDRRKEGRGGGKIERKEYKIEIKGI